MKKRLLGICLTVVMMFALAAGCSGTGESEDEEVRKASAGTSEASADQQKELTKVTLNEVAHSIFYAPMYVAIEEGYFEEEGIELDLVCGFGADKTMTAVISGEADIGFMGSEASIYTYNEGAADYVVNFAQLTQRAGNFLVAREEMPDFTWEDLKGTNVLGGPRAVCRRWCLSIFSGKTGLTRRRILRLIRILTSGLLRRLLQKGKEILRLSLNQMLPVLKMKARALSWLP